MDSHNGSIVEWKQRTKQTGVIMAQTVVGPPRISRPFTPSSNNLNVESM